MKILSNDKLVTLQIYYYLPDFNNIVQEFIWQYTDVKPEFNRTHSFLSYWHENIDAEIQNIYLAHCDYWGNKIYRNVTNEYTYYKEK